MGSGVGFSVRQVIEQVQTTTNRTLEVVEGKRRPGDATKLVSGSTKASNELHWIAKRSDLEKMVQDAWRWHITANYKK